MEEVRVTPAGPGDLEAFVDTRPGAPRRRRRLLQPLSRHGAGRGLAGGPGPDGAIQPFLAVRGAEPVGRVAALLHPALVEAPGRPLGQVGYYSAPTIRPPPRRSSRRPAAGCAPAAPAAPSPR